MLNQKKLELGLGFSSWMPQCGLGTSDIMLHNMVCDVSALRAAVRPVCHVKKTQSLEIGSFYRLEPVMITESHCHLTWILRGHLTGGGVSSTLSPSFPPSCPLLHFLFCKEALVSSEQIGQEGGKPCCPATSHRTFSGGHLAHQDRWSQRRPYSTVT